MNFINFTTNWTPSYLIASVLDYLFVNAEKVADCPATQHLVDGICVDTIAQCSTEQRLVDGICVDNEPTQDWSTYLWGILGAGVTAIAGYAGKAAFDKLVKSDVKDLQKNLTTLGFTAEQSKLLGSDKAAMAFIILAADNKNPLSSKAILDLAKTDQKAFVYLATQGKDDNFKVGYFGDAKTPTTDAAKAKIIADTVAAFKKATTATTVNPVKPVDPVKPVITGKPETPATTVNPGDSEVPKTLVPVAPVKPKAAAPVTGRRP